MSPDKSGHKNKSDPVFQIPPVTDPAWVIPAQDRAKIVLVSLYKVPITRIPGRGAGLYTSCMRAAYRARRAAL
jgi:hypothetical protein